MNNGKAVFLCFLLAVSVFFCVSNIYAQESQSLFLDNLIKEALDSNPKIQQAYHKWKATELRINTAKGLPDPNLSYGYFGENVETKVGPQEQKFGVSQKVPFPGKLRYKGKVQAKEAQIFKQKYETVKNEIIKNIKITFYDLYFLDRALEINEEEKEILEQTEKVAQRKYESNTLPQQNVIKLQIELSNIIKKIALINQSRKSAVAKMNRLLNRKSDKSIDIIKQIEVREFSDDLNDIMEKTKGFSRDLIAANLTVDKAELEKSLAKMEFLPDFTLGYEYIDIGGGTTALSDDGKDAWMGKVSVNVPIWFGKIRSSIKAKEEELKAAREMQEDTEDLIVYEVQDLYFKITTQKEIVSLYKTALVPQAQQAFDASQTGFETGSVSFIDWLDTQRTYLQTRLAYYKTITDYQKAIALLEKAIGYTEGEYNEE